MKETIINTMQLVARKYDYDDWEKMCKYLLIDGYPDVIKLRFEEALQLYQLQFKSQQEIIQSL